MTRALSLILIVALLLTACTNGPKREPTWKIPRLRGSSPVEVFENLIEQVKGIGDGLGRMFRGIGPRH